MKKPIKIIVAIIAIVFAFERIACPAPRYALRPAASRLTEEDLYEISRARVVDRMIYRIHGWLRQGRIDSTRAQSLLILDVLPFFADSEECVISKSSLSRAVSMLYEYLESSEAPQWDEYAAGILNILKKYSKMKKTEDKELQKRLKAKLRGLLVAKAIEDNIAQSDQSDKIRIWQSSKDSVLEKMSAGRRPTISQPRLNPYSMKDLLDGMEHLFKDPDSYPDLSKAIGTEQLKSWKRTLLRTVKTLRASDIILVGIRDSLGGFELPWLYQREAHACQVSYVKRNTFGRNEVFLSMALFSSLVQKIDFYNRKGDREKSLEYLRGCYGYLLLPICGLTEPRHRWQEILRLITGSSEKESKPQASKLEDFVNEIAEHEEDVVARLIVEKFTAAKNGERDRDFLKTLFRRCIRPPSEFSFFLLQILGERGLTSVFFDILKFAEKKSEDEDLELLAEAVYRRCEEQVIKHIYEVDRVPVGVLTDRPLDVIPGLFARRTAVYHGIVDSYNMFPTPGVFEKSLEVLAALEDDAKLAGVVKDIGVEDPYGDSERSFISTLNRVADGPPQYEVTELAARVQRRLDRNAIEGIRNALYPEDTIRAHFYNQRAVAKDVAQAYLSNQSEAGLRYILRQIEIAYTSALSYTGEIELLELGLESQILVRVLISLNDLLEDDLLRRLRKIWLQKEDNALAKKALLIGSLILEARLYNATRWPLDEKEWQRLTGYYESYAPALGELGDSAAVVELGNFLKVFQKANAAGIAGAEPLHYKTRFYLGKALFKLGTDTQNPETLRTAAMHLNMFASRHRDDATEAAKAAAVLALRAFNMAERLRKLRKATAAIEQAA